LFVAKPRDGSLNGPSLHPFHAKVPGVPLQRAFGKDGTFAGYRREHDLIHWTELRDRQCSLVLVQLSGQRASQAWSVVVYALAEHPSYQCDETPRLIPNATKAE
jgi:hypothetical protein